MAKPTMDAYHEASSAKASGKKKLSEIIIKPTKNKGHVVEHHYDNSESGVFMHRPEVHAFGNGPEVLQHLKKHLGIKEEEIAEAQDHHEGEDTETPGGAGKESSNDEGTKAKHKGRSKAEEKGED